MLTRYQQSLLNAQGGGGGVHPPLQVPEMRKTMATAMMRYHGMKLMKMT
jgi:hypothetical protein